MGRCLIQLGYLRCSGDGTGGPCSTMSCVADVGIETDSGSTTSGVTGVDGVTSGVEGTSKEIPEGGGITFSASSFGYLGCS